MDHGFAPGEWNRRRFLSGAAALAAPLAVRAAGANGKLAVGMIGLGIRGSLLLERLYSGSQDAATVTAVCDAYTGNLVKASARIETLSGSAPRRYADYRELLQDKSLDAVIVATPEHLHCVMLLDALAAGKHVYIEKPLAHSIEEGEKILRAAANSKSVVQVGMQNRSNSLYAKAKEMVAAGMIGEVHYTRAFWYRNSLDNAPAWRYAIPADANPQNTDWARFLGDAPPRPFSKPRFFQWRLYWDYSGGISTDLLVHQTDIAQFVLGKSAPASCMATGATLRWTADDREVPDTLSAIFEYDGGFHLNYSCYFGNDRYGYGEQFMGNEGTIEVLNRQYLNFYPEKFAGQPPAHIAARQQMSLALPGNDTKAVEAHLRNFLQAVRGTEQPIAPLDAGQRANVSGHLATLSLQHNRKVFWDQATRTWRA
ncbi:MAG TPA: Gfo/Idh/MocA family oxidoreductase [Bryobacteraceae bacterium]|nr:Gfo/Idh/MocA family oxidoreductase [Bryobacteraceae bacterium]